MTGNVLTGLTLTVATAFIHGLAMTGGFRILRLMKVEKWDRSREWVREATIAALVLMMSIAALIEAMIWAVAYLQTGALEGFKQALYFSLVTYTTLGFGDITLGEDHRLLSALEAANGIIMFGWTTALIYAFVQRVYGLGQAQSSTSRGD